MTSTLDAVRPDVKVVDADTHLTERHDLWTSRAPAGLQDRMPHVYPDPLTSAQENMRELSPEVRNKILGGNAAKLYHL